MVARAVIDSPTVQDTSVGCWTKPTALTVPAVHHPLYYLWWTFFSKDNCFILHNFMPKFYSMKVNFLWQTERYCVKLANLKKSLTVKYHEKRMKI